LKDISTALATHLKQQVTTVCTCVSIRRKRDDVSYHFTDHDRPLTIQGQRFMPYNSFQRFSVNSSVDMDVDGMEIRGMIRESGIERESVASGLFDFAEVEVFLINYEEPDEGSLILRRGWLGEVVMDEDGTFRAEIRGLSQVYATRVGEAYSPECRADLGDRRCKIGLSPEPWKANTNYCTGDSVLGVVEAANAYLNVSIENHSFEEDLNQDSIRDITGWTTRGDSTGEWAIVASANVAGISGPRHGDYFIIHINPMENSRSRNLAIYQDIDLVDQGVLISDLDTGLCRVVFEMWAACLLIDHRCQYRMRLYALNDADGIIGGTPIWDTGYKYTAYDRWYQTRVQDRLLPVGTRKVRIDIESQKQGFKPEGCAFDLARMIVNTPSGTFSNADQYAGVMFQCITAGTSGDSEPSWTNAIGNTFSDGSVVWRCVNGWKSIGVVSIIDEDAPKEFNVTGLVNLTGYFDGGLLQWETGQNAGRVQEVFTYVNDGGVSIKLFQRTFYPITVGDRFVVHPGCDKRRATCSDKFSNIINFRGEPDVPGTDEYMRTPNASGGMQFTSR